METPDEGRCDRIVRGGGAGRKSLGALDIARQQKVLAQTEGVPAQRVLATLDTLAQPPYRGGVGDAEPCGADKRTANDIPPQVFIQWVDKR